MPSTPTRLPEDIYAAASAIAPGHGRTPAQQIAHWARIGREFERVPLRHVESVLTGTRSYDDLTDREQAIARAEIDKRMEETRASLDLEAEFLAQGITSWVSTDEHGNVEMQGPDHEG
ncbi:ParD-like family protein [Brachybacterium sp. JHP9]|uniref:ParD-like family protein n=1 Tax=Brachybacterium equifaecis TaxID=2910770 RepID=A0ABT0R2P4_9MICO|nr:ParD-like family protein [Brachybacterium equifaecis]MCL6424040.1 ParD-like family protein [Brachybacterium equifaecis]